MKEIKKSLLVVGLVLALAATSNVSATMLLSDGLDVVQSNGTNDGVVYSTLTDGVTYNIQNQGGQQIWFGSSGGALTIILGMDFGQIYDIEEVKLHMVNGSYYGITSPHTVDFKVSDDGSTWSTAASLTFDKAVNNTTKINPLYNSDQYYWSSTGLLTDVSARYLNIELTMDMDGYNKQSKIDEIEVYGVPEPMTLSLLTAGGIIAFRRRKVKH